MSKAQQSVEQEPESKMALAELVAMRRIPDHHAFAMRLYVGDDNAERTLSEWTNLYDEMMSKPTGMPKEQWHEQFVQKLKAR
jgi:hypothetical protein